MGKVIEVAYVTHIGRFLRQYRMKHGIFREDMAAAMGAAPSWLANIESGRTAIPKGFAELLASTFKMTQLELRDLRNAIE